MLMESEVIAFVPTRDPAKAREFYEQTLGLQFVKDDRFALVFKAAGISLRIANVSSMPDFKPAPFTILGWRVQNVEKAVRELSARGAVFERFPGMSQNELGIWTSPGGAQVAWFKDPDGNVLSVTEV